MELKEQRIAYGLTQSLAAVALGVPLRTYKRYENDNSYGDPHKRQSFLTTLNDKYAITEEKGLLDVKSVQRIVTEVIDSKYRGRIDFCYLFGSYAKGTAKENSDVDLYVSTTLNGLAFVGLIEDLRVSLKKRVDLIRSAELKDNIELTNEIMKWGMRIYG